MTQLLEGPKFYGKPSSTVAVCGGSMTLWVHDFLGEWKIQFGKVPFESFLHDKGSKEAHLNTFS